MLPSFDEGWGGSKILAKQEYLIIIQYIYKMFKKNLYT
jgi:hypothetical protein